MRLKLAAAVLFIVTTSCQTNPVGSQDRQTAGAPNDIEKHPAYIAADAATREKAQEIVKFRQASIEKDTAESTDHLARRDTHSKQHGCVRAEVTVNADLAPQYQTSVFKPGRAYHAWLRFANGVGGNHHDLAPDARAMSIKLMGVDAPKVLAQVPDEERYTQDFIMNNYPAFFLDGADDSYEFFKAVYENKAASFFTSAFKLGASHDDRRRALFDAVNIQSKIEPNLMAASYWSATPFKLGSQVVKFAARPCAGFVDSRVKQLPLATMSADDKKWINYAQKVYGKFSPLSSPKNETNKPPASFLAQSLIILNKFQSAEKNLSPASRDYLSETMADYLSSQKGGCFELGVQVFKDEKTTPTEKPSVVWFSSATPFIPVAKVTVPSQKDFTEAANLGFCEDLSFSPWHAATDMAPVGQLNQVRGIVYSQISQYRHATNAHPRLEPLDNYSLKFATPAEADQYYRR